jgi:hypothetical protein
MSPGDTNPDNLKLVLDNNETSHFREYLPNSQSGIINLKKDQRYVKNIVIILSGRINNKIFLITIPSVFCLLCILAHPFLQAKFYNGKSKPILDFHNIHLLFLEQLKEHLL